MKEIIAMHGWCGESSNWIKWRQYFEKDGWLWQNHERGYGGIETKSTGWSKNIVKNSLKKQILICHSLGLHLINKEILQNASHIILLSSFSRFIPPSANNRSIKTALKGMMNALGTPQETKMISKFLKKSYKPYPLDMTTSDLLNKGLSLSGRKKLADDLELLIRTNGLPNGFPKKSLVLAIHGEKDAILFPGTKAQLINDLTNYLEFKPILWNLSGRGHSLFQVEVMHRVNEWIDSHL